MEHVRTFTIVSTGKHIHTMNNDTERETPGSVSSEESTIVESPLSAHYLYSIDRTCRTRSRAKHKGTPRSRRLSFERGREREGGRLVTSSTYQVSIGVMFD